MPSDSRTVAGSAVSAELRKLVPPTMEAQRIGDDVPVLCHNPSLLASIFFSPAHKKLDAAQQQHAGNKTH